MNDGFLNFKKKGWIVEKRIFNKSEINIIKSKINLFLEKNINKYSGRDINFFHKKKKVNEINSFHKMDDCKFIKKIAFSKKIYDISKKYLNSKKPDLRASELFAKPKFYGLAAPIHQDNFYWCVNDANAITIWIALDKSNKENGGVFYFDGSHLNGILDHTQSFSKGSSQKIKNENELAKYNKSYPSLEIGDCLIHHSLVAHGSARNKSSENRSGLTFQYKSENSFYHKNLIDKYEKSLSNQIKLRLN